MSRNVWLAVFSLGVAVGTTCEAMEGADAGKAKRIPEWIRPAPPLAKPTGRTIRVATAAQLINAVDTVKPGTTILLADGTYLLPRGLILRENGLALRGQSGDRDKVILDGSKSPDKHIVMVKGADDVLIANLTIQNCMRDGVNIKGEMDTQRTRIYNCMFRNLWVRCIKGTAPLRVRKGLSEPRSEPDLWRRRPTGGSIRYCLFLQERRKPYDDWKGGDYIGGIDVMWLKDWVIADNVFVGIRGKHGDARGAIFIWQHSENVIVERNLILNCDAGICFGNAWGPPLHVNNGIIRNNFVVGGTNRPVEVCKTRNVLVCNNTIWATDLTLPSVHFHQGAEGGRFYNNLVHGRVKLAPIVKSGNNIIGDLKGYFIAPLKGNLHLTENAKAALGKGKPLAEVSDDFDGQERMPAPDIGADEIGIGRLLGSETTESRLVLSKRRSGRFTGAFVSAR